MPNKEALVKSTGPHPHHDCGKKHQINVKWTCADIELIDDIASAELRDRSEVIRFFFHWGIPYFRALGSFGEMNRHSFVDADQKESAMRRLELRQTAERELSELNDEWQQSTGENDESTTRKARRGKTGSR